MGALPLQSLFKGPHYLGKGFWSDGRGRVSMREGPPASDWERLRATVAVAGGDPRDVGHCLWKGGGCSPCYMGKNQRIRERVEPIQGEIRERTQADYRKAYKKEAAMNGLGYGRKLFIPHPEGGAMPTRHSGYTTTGIPLPVGIRYDPMGFAGLGQGETPVIRPLPYKKATETEMRAERKAERWDKASMLIGVIGGVLGIVLSYRALRGDR